MKNRLISAFLICLLTPGLALGQYASPALEDKKQSNEPVSYFIPMAVGLAGCAIGYAIYRYDTLRQLRGGAAVAPFVNLFKGIIGPGSNNFLRADRPRSDVNNAASAVEALPPVQARKPSLEGVRVAVIDDVPMNLALAKRKLSLLGAEVVTGENGDDAFTLAIGTDVILMDNQMPLHRGEVAVENAGLRTARRISELPGRHAVIIMHSSDLIDPEICQEHGAADQLQKGVAKKDEYEAKVFKALKHSGE